MNLTENPLSNLRHSCAHLLAAAVKDLYPGAHNAIGPSIENGFYQDFDMGKYTISEADLGKIEKRMREMLKHWGSFEEKEVSVEQALKDFASNPYKVELINEFAKEGKKITENNPGNFLDLCKGGHSGNPKVELKNFKLLSVAGAYWRGDEKKKMLTRIYGTLFTTREELEQHLQQIQEAKKRDHRKLGKELDLFTFSDLVGSGLPLYTPKGALIRKLLFDFVEKVQSAEGYSQVWTPQIAKAELFKLSGHYDKYKADLFMVKSNYSKEEMFLKPMNCPQHAQIYASRPRSYRDLPLRFTDFAMLYRDERPGELNGLARVRSFSQDDCHIFCREDQVDEEIDRALIMTKKIMKIFNFKYRYRLSTRDPKDQKKYIGDPKVWDKVEKWAVKIMQRNKIEYYDGPGEAAFYAPKMDLMATDALGREWQLSTVQIDFFMPTRFGLKYTGDEGSEKKPVMIHRAILGSIERFLMVILEHYAGAFPLWLSPIQVEVLPISDNQLDYSQKVQELLKVAGIRTELKDQNKTIGAKIRESTLQKIPYMVIIGDRELQANKVSVRARDGKDLGMMNINEFITILKSQIEKFL